MAFCKFREDERNGWDKRAYLYANATARATCQSIPALLASANLFPDARVLDAGCGPGYVAGCASILGSICQGVDFAPEMIAQARKRFPHIPFEVGDIEKLKAEDSSQDAVLSNIVLFHVADPLMAMKEAFRVLKPGDDRPLLTLHLLIKTKVLPRSVEPAAQSGLFLQVALITSKRRLCRRKR